MVYGQDGRFPFKLSRSKIDLFLECPRCFWLDRKMGISRPGMPSFTLNSAVDALLKKEFDLLRENGQPHQLMKQYGIEAIPFKHPDLDEWRNNFVGKQYFHRETNFWVFGAVDDIWVNKNGELHIVDYKSTSTENEISLDDQYKQMFKKQVEVYQWIFRKSGFEVSPLAYFVYANAGKNRPKFDGRLEFELQIISYRGDDSWVEKTLFEIKKCLESEKIPPAGENCEYCRFNQQIEKINFRKK
ncbi:MAG: PD-(D/E)XK nuclease family protein [Microgenomates group bacterium]